MPLQGVVLSARFGALTAGVMFVGFGLLVFDPCQYLGKRSHHRNEPRVGHDIERMAQVAGGELQMVEQEDLFPFGHIQRVLDTAGVRRCTGAMSRRECADKKIGAGREKTSPKISNTVPEAKSYY